MANDITTEPTTIMTTEDTLLAFSEWLDSEHLIVSDQKGDSRTHEELAKEFVQQWEEREGTATLAGRLGARFNRLLSKALHDAADALGPDFIQ